VACALAATSAWVGVAAAAPGTRALSLTWVGDISLSRHNGLPPNGGRSVFGSVARPLRSSRITVGNLEGTLGTGGTSKCGGGRANCFAFQAPSSYAGVFARAGFDVMNLANNHALDFGPTGQRQTTAALRRHGIAYTGRPGEILVRRVGDTRIALVGFAPYPWAAPLLDPAAAMRLVRRARRRADVVAVLIHAGAEGSDRLHTPRSTEFAFGENRGRPRAFAHAVVRAGADLVLGSGPHVVRGVERYRGRLIAYSLGNFLGYRTLSTGGVLSLSGMLTVRLSRSGRPLGGRWWSVRLDSSGVPHRDRSGASARLVAGLSRQDFGPAAYPIRRDGRLGAWR
jgi:Bacterial capsule synthesis protein PGA_cap